MTLIFLEYIMARKLSMNNIMMEYKGNRKSEVKEVSRDSPHGSE